MKHFISLIGFIVMMNNSWSQLGTWDVYLAEYETGPGSTLLNMDLKNLAPLKELPFVVITGVTFENCDEDGFPDHAEFENLYLISDAVQAKLQELTESELTGTFTHQCQRLDYTYVADTTLIRAELAKLYKTEFPSYTYYFNLRTDPEWQGYLKFLYPNEETLEFMQNEKVLSQLRRAGDNLSTPRQIDHWIYFKDKENRNLFVDLVTNEGYQIESEDELEDATMPFQLHISRTDHLDPIQLSQVTLSLKKIVAQFDGEYDGWETFVIVE